MVAKLIDKAHELGYGVTGGDWFRDTTCSHGHKRSLHKIRLAIDLNLFKWDEELKEWKYLSETKDHQQLGHYWESIGGAWGGRWGDGNHYSVNFQGMR